MPAAQPPVRREVARMTGARPRLDQIHGLAGIVVAFIGVKLVDLRITALGLVK